MTASTLRRLGVIVGGYAVAWGAAELAVWWHDRNLSPADQLAMSGMLAFGDIALFWAVAAPIAIVPTLLAFSFVRARPRFWRLYARVLAAPVFLLAYSPGLLRCRAACRITSGSLRLRRIIRSEVRTAEHIRHTSDREG